jgi:hypothetical protein
LKLPQQAKFFADEVTIELLLGRALQFSEAQSGEIQTPDDFEEA